MFPDRETTSYNVTVPSEDWSRWKDTVPRSTTLYERLHELIQEDAKAHQRGGYDDMEERTARLLATRIQHRGRTARQALDRGDSDAVEEQLDKMIEIARLFEE
jgi:hypothetical protein